jgi:hypothetical protein
MAEPMKPISVGLSTPPSTIGWVTTDRFTRHR